MNNFTKEYEILFRDTDYKLRCTMSSIVYFLCDVGNAHAESVGDTIEFLKEHKCAWVFYKYDIKVNRYPMYREKISVTTMPVGFKKFYALRDYVIKSESGEVLVEATALFFMINIEKRRPMRIMQKHYEMYGAEGDNKEIKELDKVLKVTCETVSKLFQIRYSDIDINTHVNNGKYVEWALEAVPKEIIKDNQVRRMKIIFEKEVAYGHMIKSVVQVEKSNGTTKTIHKIVDDNDTELTLLEIDWDK